MEWREHRGRRSGSRLLHWIYMDTVVVHADHPLLWCTIHAPFSQVGRAMLDALGCLRSLLCQPANPLGFYTSGYIFSSYLRCLTVLPLPMPRFWHRYLHLSAACSSCCSHITTSQCSPHPPRNVQWSCRCVLPPTCDARPRTSRPCFFALPSAPTQPPPTGLPQSSRQSLPVTNPWPQQQS